MILGSVVIFPATGGFASEPGIDLNRNAVYTAADGNIARLAAAPSNMRQLANASAYYVAGNPGTGLDRTGVNAQYSNAGGRDGILRVNDGTKNQAAASAWNNWGSAYGVESNPVYVVYNLGAPYIINSMRVEFTADGNFYSSGTQIPRQAFVEYWDGAAWVRVTNISRPVGDPHGGPIATSGAEAGNFVNDAHIEGNGSIDLANRPNWNKVVFNTPIMTSMLRLCLTQRQTAANTNGIGVSEWEVFGTQNPAIADIGSISISLFQNLVSDVTLPSTGPQGSVFTWSDSTNPAALANDGKVTRPDVDTPDATGTIKVTAVNGADIAERTFDFNVLAIPNEAKPDVEAVSINLINLINNVALPSAQGGSTLV